MLLAVDPAHDRVYALESFTRRAADEEEEEHAPEEFPLDDEQPAAGALYGFEYTATGLTALNGGKPLIGAEALALQGESPEEAILNPRGIAVDPSGKGDVVIAASEDTESNKNVEDGSAEKQCRPLAQYLVPTESGGKVTAAALGHRFADAKGKMIEEDEDGEVPGCGEKEAEDAYERTPLSPVVTSQGRLLAYFDEYEGQIWEVAAPTEAEAAKAGTTTVTPHELYRQEPFPAEEFAQVGEEVGLSEISLVSEGSDEGALYLNAVYFPFGGQTGAPIVLHVTEPAKPTEPAKLTDVGFTAAAEILTDEVAPACGIWDQASNPAQVAGLEGKGYLAFSQYQTKAGGVVEMKEFGEGASTSGCPGEPTLTPVVNTENGENESVAPVGKEVTLQDTIATLKEPFKEAGLARSVEWIIKYHLEGGKEGEEKIPVAYPEPESGTVELKHTFANVGTYEISAAITTTDLGHPVAQLAPADVVKVEASPLTTLKMLTPSPDKVQAHGVEVMLGAEVEAPVKGEKFVVTGVRWNFGDKARSRKKTTSTK